MMKDKLLWYLKSIADECKEEAKLHEVDGNTEQALFLRGKASAYMHIRELIEDGE